MKFQDVARFEFRVFGNDLARFRDAFAALGPGSEQPPSRETYIVTRLNVESNVKIRSHRLEVKGLQGRLQVLEQWQPVLKSEFPVSADEIENVVAPALGIDVDLGAAPPFSEEALVGLAAEQPALAVAVVDKNRTLFDLGACEAEFTELRIDADRLQTVAIEAPEARPAEALLRRTGLDAARNESYSLFLQVRLFQQPR
jgi:hypothetical protein